MAGRHFRRMTLAALLTIGLCAPAAGEDWPMWRADARRSAATAQRLPAELHVQWVRHLPQLATAWPDQAKMVFDRNYEPIVQGGRMFVASSITDSVTAYDTKTGDELWRFYADGPVRFAPVAGSGNIYFASDDGNLYCLRASDGSLAWKVRGGPNDQKILGNGRLISVWPARGGPVLADSTVYFAASIWPFMGIFIHAVDAETGQTVWVNDGDSANYIIQPHRAYSFAGVTPQGALCVAGDKLLVPGGRSVPACLDRKTGRQLYFDHGRRAGGSDVFAFGEFFINNGEICDLASGGGCGRVPGAVAFDEGRLYTADKGVIRSLPFPSVEATERKDRRGRTETVRKLVFGEQSFALKTPEPDELIRVGNRFYGAKENRIFAVDVPPGGESSETVDNAVSWQTEVEGRVVRLLAADDRLFAVTLEGGIYCFGAEQTEPKQHNSTPQSIAGNQAQSARAKALLDTVNPGSGYCLLWGIGDGGLAAELLTQSELSVIAFDASAEKVAAARQRFAAAGLLGRRISIHQGQPDSLQLPPYLARLMVVTELNAANASSLDASLSALYKSLRPFGGTACFALSSEQQQQIAAALARLNLPQAQVDEKANLLTLTRAGALPGSGNWTHEHADAANTRVSPDSLVKTPLGVLWFGGASHEPILPRHGHGPQPQVVDGRLIIEGPDLLRCLDIYTGGVLWERELKGVGEIYNNTGHHPGANGTGANYISVPDGIYVLYGKQCLRIDPDTGKTMSQFELPDDEGGDPLELCYINVAGDYLILGADLGDAEAAERKYEDYISCQMLVVLNRQSGKQLWTAKARFQFRNNAICAGGGRLYCVDLLSDFEAKRLQRRGEKATQPSKLSVLDLKTGEPLWSTEAGVFGAWLSYSAEHDMLFESGRPGRDVLRGEPRGIRAFDAASGDVRWETGDLGPAMVHGNRILNGTGKSFDILTGAPSVRIDPITGQEQQWTWSRNYGCNTPQASKHLLLFRSGAAGFYDLTRDGGTGNFGGFRSSCTNNLIAAGGVLSAPDYTRTCSCAYQNQTSLALIHMPQAEMWTFTPFKFDDDAALQRLGVNFGAPGDRRTDDGALWIDFPSVGGDSPEIPVSIRGDELRFVRRHASQIAAVSDEGLPWVAASAVIGLREITIPLGGKDFPRRYLLKLHFAELEGLPPGERVFDIAINGKTLAAGFDPAKAAGGPHRTSVSQFEFVAEDADAVISFSPVKGQPLICGVELIAQ